ncbi:MAG: hypothetical protein ACE5K4_00240 [Candidatus Hydrothermarchaeota archaeon]
MLRKRLFGKTYSEISSEVEIKKESKVEKSEKVLEMETIRELFGSFMEKKSTIIQNDYKIAYNSLKNLNYSIKTVEEFSKDLWKLQDLYTDIEDFKSKAGVFLSALINVRREEDMCLDLRKLRDPLDYVGVFLQGGRIIIEGNVGDRLGHMMRSGRIEIKGNAGEKAGSDMYGGEIIIHGDAGHKAGHYMWGGKMEIKGNTGYMLGYNMLGGEIIIHGDTQDMVGNWMTKGSIRIKGRAGEHVGLFMIGGEIHLDGEYTSVTERRKGGKIYHKGRLIEQKIGIPVRFDMIPFRT